MRASARETDYTTLHLRFGWWSLFVFATVGLVLETLHGFKVGLYLDLTNDTRRLMWTLAHAHGVGLALVHLLFALNVQLAPSPTQRRYRLISRCLVAASVLLPGGFFAGGTIYYGGDPGLGVLLVPVGAVLLLIPVFLLARDTKNLDRSGTTAVRPRKS
jgi:hypothetical protein